MCCVLVRFFCHRVVILMSLVTTILVAPVYAERGPLLKVLEPEFNFGTVSEGSKVEHDFGLKNVGDTDLTIQRVSASCGCTAAVASSTTIKPGGVEKVKVSFNTLGFFGPKTKTIYVVSNSIDKPESVLRLKGIVNRGVEVTPKRLDFGAISPSLGAAPLEKEVAVHVDPAKSREISAVRSYSKYLAVSPIQERNGRTVFSVGLKSSVPRGEFRERVVIQFKDSKYPPINVPVVAFVKKDLRLNPSTVSFGIIEGREIIERRVIVENRSSENIDITKLTSSHPAVTASVAERKGDAIVLALQLDPTKTSGDLRGVVDVVTSRAKDGVLSLSVFGVAPPK